MYACVSAFVFDYSQCRSSVSVIRSTCRRRLVKTLKRVVTSSVVLFTPFATAGLNHLHQNDWHVSSLETVAT